MATGDDDLLPLSRLFTPRPRIHQRHLTFPSSPSPQPPRNGVDVVFSVGDLVWVKAFPFTWWPGILRRFRGTFVLVYLFGGDERPRWFRLTKLRPFEEGYAVSSKSKLKPQIALALEELGRRTLVGLMCPCQRTLVDPRRLPCGEAALPRVEFSSADIVHFVRRRAVCAWGDRNDENDDPLVVKFLARVIAFRRSFGFVAGGKGGFDSKRLLGTVLDMSAGIPVGNTTGRTVDVVMAHRRFVSEMPGWVFREVMDLGGDSSSSEGSDSEEEIDDDFVGSVCIEDNEGPLDACADNVQADVLGARESSLNVIIDSVDGIEVSTENLQETRMVTDSSHHSISSVNPQIKTSRNCSVNAEMDVDSFIEVADNAVEGMQMTDNRLELQSGERIFLKDQPVIFSEFGKAQGRICRRSGCRTKGEESTNILQETLTWLYSLASDPCHSLKKNHKAKFSRLLELRSFLFLKQFDRESASLVAIPDDSETSNISAQTLVESIPKETDISPVSAVILDPRKRNNHATDRSHHLSDAPLDRQLFSPAAEPKFTERTYEYLRQLKNVAVDISFSVDGFVEENCKKFLHYRKLSFLNNVPNSVDHNVKFFLESRDEIVSKNKKSMEMEKDPLASCTEMDEVPGKRSTCDRHVLGKVSGDTGTDDPYMCITDKDTDFQNQVDSGTLIEASANAEPVSSMCGASNNVSGCFEKRIRDESASGSCEIQKTETPGQKVGLDSSTTEKILRVDQNGADNMDVGPNPLNDHVSTPCLDSNGDGKRNKARLLVENGHVMKPVPTSKDIFHGKKRREHTLPYQSKVQKHQPGLSLGRLYASPLMAETSKPTQKSKSANNSKCIGSCKTLHMKFPKDFKLPSKEELEKKFRVFGRLDRSKTKIFFYTGAAKIVFLQATDARAAYIYANKKRIFTCVDVRFWFDEHERFREGNSRGPLSISSRECSLNLKSCLRKPDPRKEKDERKDHKVKFTTDDFPCPSTATANPTRFPSTISNGIPSQDKDISGPMLHLLVKCDNVVSSIKKTLGLESYYSIFSYTYGLSAES